jgi:dephospho-CoA kinase
MAWTNHQSAILATHHSSLIACCNLWPVTSILHTSFSSVPSVVNSFGLTGGIACGKSTVADFFSRLGARVIDADAIGHQLLRRPGAAYDEVIRVFGTGVLDATGEIDRKRLGAIVFSDTQKRRELESILHPRIIKRQNQLAHEYRQKDPNAVILTEAGLIYEAGVEHHFAKIVVAWCKPEQQVERLVAKTGYSRAEAEARIAAQMPMDVKRGRADFVIDCSGTLEETRRQVKTIYGQLRQLAAKG